MARAQEEHRRWDWGKPRSLSLSRRDILKARF